MAQKIAHDLVWWLLTLLVTALRSAETAALRKYVQQSANWQKLCSSSTPFPVGVTEHHVMEVLANTHTRLIIQLMHRLQCAHAACLHLGDDVWLKDLYSSLLWCATRQRWLITQSSWTPAMPYSHATKMKRSIPLWALKTNSNNPLHVRWMHRPLSAEQVEIYKRMLPLQKCPTARGTGLSFNRDLPELPWKMCIFDQIFCLDSLFFIK